MNVLFAQANDGNNKAPDAISEGFSVLQSLDVQALTQQAIQFGINLVLAVLILVIGRWIALWIARMIRTASEKANMDETLAVFTRNLAYITMMTLVIIAALVRLGLDPTSLAAGVAAGGIAIGLALQGSLANIAAGFMIIFFRHFKLGDYVEAGGTAGTITAIQMFQSVLTTPDNRQIVVPNSQITAGTIVNFSAHETRRIDLVIGCGYNDDLKAVKNYLIEILTSDERVLKNPEPVVVVGELGDSSVNFLVRPWVKSEDYWTTKWDLLEKIKTGFDEKGFNIPFPQQEVHMHQVAGRP
ncbi:MAG: mechanosensitive ion channel family protein [Gemmataceae bacterium]